MRGDQRAGNDRLARARGSHQHAEFVPGKGVMGGPLFGVQVGGEPELLWLPAGTQVGQFKPAARLLDQGGDPLL